jgi:putative tricarboxylic transport membrane protein
MEFFASTRASARARNWLSSITGATSVLTCVGMLAAGTAQADPVTVDGFPDDTLQIIVPTNPGGGIDTTARKVQEILVNQGIAAKPIEVINVPGGSQTVGLARLLSQYGDNGHTVLFISSGLVGGIYLNKAPVNLDGVTPIGNLTAEYNAIAVSKDSKYQTIQQLAEDFKRDPKSVVWGGGPGGSSDHMVVGSLAKVLGVDPSQINYVAFSGSEPRAQIMGNQFTAGTVGFGELQADAEAGLLRILAVTGPQRVPGTSYPTLKESGIDLVLTQWRGVVAGPNISDASRKAWVEMLTRMHDSQAWADTRKEFDWIDYFLPGEKFGEHLQQENKRIGDLVHDLGLVQ